MTSDERSLLLLLAKMVLSGVRKPSPDDRELRAVIARLEDTEPDKRDELVESFRAPTIQSVCKKYGLEARMIHLMPPVWSLIGERALEALPELQQWDHPLGGLAAVEVRCFRTVEEFETHNPNWPSCISDVPNWY